ncbi:hypothetical protein [Clostridium sp.]|uniref:hypothetical protein n=1 Tax=Clostridium sp. TaxID=1506 RepID=UPI0032170597
MKHHVVENMQGLEQCTGKEAEDKKSLSVTDQSKQIDTNVIILEKIIPSGTDLDNGEIYNIKTGETIRRIDDVPY